MSGKLQKQNKFLRAYDKYADEIFRFCMLKVRDREVTLDIVQDTFIRTLEYLNKGNEIKQIRPFLYKTAYNLIIDYSRKKKTASLEDNVNLDTDFGQDDLSRNIDSMDGKIAMELLNHLTKTYRTLIEMKHLQGLTLDEIASITDKRKQTVSVQIHRAEKVLRELYKDKYEKDT